MGVVPRTAHETWRRKTCGLWCLVSAQEGGVTLAEPEKVVE